jgi:hypothetical protein
VISIKKPDGTESPLPAGVYLVSRPKIGGPLTHYGVLATGFSGCVDEVVESNMNGIRILPFNEFAQGLTVTILSGKPPHEAHDAILRARDLLQKRPGYSLLGFNCEHLARQIYDGTAKSKQADGLLTVVGVIVVGVLISKI